MLVDSHNILVLTPLSHWHNGDAPARLVANGLIKSSSSCTLVHADAAPVSSPDAITLARARACPINIGVDGLAATVAADASVVSRL